MYDSPCSLQDVCVDFICENLDLLCDKTSTLPLLSTAEPLPEDNGLDEPKPNSKPTSNAMKLMFKDGEVLFLHSEIAEQVMTSLCSKKKLTDATMTLFEASSARLRYLVA